MIYSIDSSAKRIRLQIAGVDYSCQFSEFSGSDDHLSNSGIVTFRGQILLTQIDGEPTLDNWISSAFELGTFVSLDLWIGSAWVRHPRGALRIIGSDYDEIEGRLRLEVGCLLAARSFKGVPDRFLSGVEPGSATPLSAVVVNLLSSSGIENFSYNATSDFILRDRPKISGSALQSAGQMLSSTGAFMWCDSNEIIQIDDVRLGLEQPIFSGPAYQFISFQRTKVGNPPTEELLITGSYNRVWIREPTTTTTETETEPRYLTIDTQDGEVVVPFGTQTARRTTTTETIDFGSSEQVVTSDSDIASSTVYRGWENYPETGLTYDAEEFRRTRYYERTASARLLRVAERVKRHRSIALAPYLDWLYKNDSDTFESTYKLGRIPAYEVDETFEYDRRDRLLRHTHEVRECLVALLAALGDPDWEKAGSLNLAGLTPTRRIVTRYEEVLPDEWEMRRETWAAQGKTAAGRTGILALIDAAENAGAYAAAINQAKKLIRESWEKIASNTGQSNPPQAERFPAKYRSESLGVEQSILFPSDVDDWQPRTTPLTIPYLPDIGPTGSPPSAIAYAYGRVWGGVQKSQWKTARIQLAMEPWLLADYRPYAQIEVIKGNRVYRLALNGTSWIADNDQALASTDAALLGEQIGATVTAGNVSSPGLLQPPYNLAGAGDRLRLLWTIRRRDTISPQYGLGERLAMVWAIASAGELGPDPGGGSGGGGSGDEITTAGGDTITTASGDPITMGGSGSGGGSS